MRALFGGAVEGAGSRGSCVGGLCAETVCRELGRL